MHQRARGTVLISVHRAGLHDLRQQGCLRACFPRPNDGAHHAILLNTSGGITDGDILHTTLHAATGASLVVATAAAERIYRARPGADPALVTIDISIAAAATLAYLPQETILFDACALDRRLRIDLAADARYIGVETLIFGRAAAGEVLRELRLRDRIELRREGRLVLHDAVRLVGDVTQMLQSRATAAGAHAVATLFSATPDAESRLEPVRAALADTGASFGASCRNGLLVVRIVAADGQQARRAVMAGLAALRDGAPLPQVWTC